MDTPASPARLVICAGQYGSASTWLYNAVHALMAAQFGAGRVHRQFADRPDELPERADPSVALLLKCHAPSRGLRWLAARAGGRVLLTLRDPRDAAASLMARFGFDYPLVSGRVAASGAALPALAAELPCLVLRYEDRFAETPETLRSVAAFLGLPASDSLIAETFARFTPDAVRGEIARMLEAGAFGPEPTAHSHDGVTHWHPGHVGDGAPGKFVDVLTEGQLGDVIRRTRGYQAAFGYPMPPPRPLFPGMRAGLETWGPGLACLGDGFAPPDEAGAWTEGAEAWLHLPLPEGGPWRLRLDLALPRLPRKKGQPAANPMRWSLWAEGDSEPLLGPTEAAATPPECSPEVTLGGATRLAFRFEGLVPAKQAGLDPSRRLLGLRLRGLTLLPA